MEKEFGDRQTVDRIFAIFKRYGYVFTSIDRAKLIHGLQEDGDNNQSMTWINRKIAHTKSLMESSKVKLDPDDAEIIVSSKDKVAVPKTIEDNLMANLFVCWVNEVLCAKSFNGKINSIKELLSDEITKSAKNVIGSDWEDSPIRTYLNQLRRHVRGEEFNQSWDNGVLSSMSAVLIKGDEWEQLLNFMQSKGMYDYRIAFALYGVLNGFANMTRDFTDLLLTTESSYLSKVYREMYGQLLEKSIPKTTNISSTIETKKTEKAIFEEETQTIIVQNPEGKKLKDWQTEIRVFAASVIKKNKQKLLDSLEEAFTQNGDNQDYFVFITMLDNFEGWKHGKNGPSKAWTRLQEHYVPDYNQRIGKVVKKQNQSRKPIQQEKWLFSGISEEQHNLYPINATSVNFVDDTNASNFILSRSYLPNEVRDVLEKKIISFQKDYALNGYYYGREDSPRTNDNTIKHFINKCTYTKGKNPSWIPVTEENKALLERLKQELYDRYANR